ncbi:phage baseplate plug family protein [Labrys neptuniae]
MQIVPLQSVPNQAISILLGGQNCQINVYTKAGGLYLDLYVDNVLIVGGVACQNLNRIVRSTYLGFVGDLGFIDNQGTSDPSYDGLGARYSLAYLEPSDFRDS